MLDLKEQITFLVNQHPNPWEQGHWYPAVTMAGRECQIKKTRAVGTNVPYLHMRYRSHTNLVTPAGEVLDRWESWMNFRANLSTYELKEI